jgi:hypothetical protein
MKIFFYFETSNEGRSTSAAVAKTQWRDSPFPVASQARHESVAPQGTCAPRNVVPTTASRGEGDDCAGPILGNARPHLNPMASEARHESVARQGTCASRNVVPQERTEDSDAQGVVGSAEPVSAAGLAGVAAPEDGRTRDGTADVPAGRGYADDADPPSPRGMLPKSKLGKGAPFSVSDELEKMDQPAHFYVAAAGRGRHSRAPGFGQHAPRLRRTGAGGAIGELRLFGKLRNAASQMAQKIGAVLHHFAPFPGCSRVFGNIFFRWGRRVRIRLITSAATKRSADPGAWFVLP